MNDTHFIALLTYGTEVKSSLPSFKFGRSAGPAILSALFGDRVQETTPPKASYRYFHVTVPKLTAHHGFIVLCITNEEKDQVEALCRKQGATPWVYLWDTKTNRWMEFPCAPQAHYLDPSSYGSVGPKFRPTSARFVMPSQVANEPNTEAGAAQGVTLTQSGDWWWITGDTYPYREVIRAAGAKWSKTRRAWYFIGQVLPQTIRDLASLRVPESEPDDPVALEPKAVQVVNATPPPVIGSAPAPDLISSAVQQLKASPQIALSPTPDRSQKHDMAPITQTYVGELTGSITGNVHCFGYGIDQGICVYLSFGGPRTAVEAIRARFSKGEIVTCVPWDGPAVELTPGEGNTGMYRDFMQNIPEARYTSVILLHEMLTSPKYGGKSRTCFIRTDEAQGITMLKHHITQLVSVPVFEEWAGYLWEAGARAHLVSRPVVAGGVDLWGIDLDSDAWTRLICAGLREGVIQLEQVV